MSNPYSVSDISQLARQQMKLYQSSTASIRDYLEASYKLTSNYRQMIKDSVIVANQMSEIDKTLRKSAISAYIKEVSGAAASVAKLTEAMKPLLSSGDLKLIATANNIKNKIEVDPVAAYSSFQKALNQQSAPRLKQLDQEVRNQIEQIKHENDERYNRSDPDDRKMDTEAIIKELQNPGNVYKTSDKDVKFSIEYFVLIFQLLALILYSSGYIANNKTFTELTYILNLINTSIELYYKQPK